MSGGTVVERCAACGAAGDLWTLDEDDHVAGVRAGAVVCRAWRRCDDRRMRQALGVAEPADLAELAEVEP